MRTRVAVTGTVSTPHTLTNTANNTTPSQLLAIGGKLTITPRALTLSASKTYDGTDSLSSSELTLGNLHSTETLTYSGAQLSDRNVTTANKYVTNLTLANGSNGGLASNYELPSLSAYDATNNSATVSARALGVSVSKVYDGLGTATAAQTTLSNLASGESLTMSNVTLSDAHVATANKYVSALSLADNGPFLASNYSLPSLSAASANNTVTITPKDVLVTVGNATGTSKVYDGNTNSSLTATLSASGFLAGESATVSYGSATYNSKNVTEANQITLGSLTLGTISGSTTGVEDGRVVTVKIDGADVGTATVTGGVWSLTGVNLSGYADGQNFTVTADVSDAAGNPATQATQVISTTDTTAPTVSIATIAGDNVVDDSEDRTEDHTSQLH